MAKNTGARVRVMLACTECKQRNYNTTKNKRNIRHATIMDKTNEKNMKKVLPYL